MTDSDLSRFVEGRDASGESSRDALSYRSLRGEVGEYQLHRYYWGRLLMRLGIAGRRDQQDRLVWVHHHLAHAASAFYLSSFGTRT